MQVVRGDFIVFFNQIFDALCKLSADSDANVQSAAHLLDRLVKVSASLLHHKEKLLLACYLNLLNQFLNLALMKQDIVTESDQFRSDDIDSIYFYSNT